MPALKCRHCMMIDAQQQALWSDAVSRHRNGVHPHFRYWRVLVQLSSGGLGSRRMQHALAEQVEPGATIQAAFDQFEAVDLPVTLAVAPGLGDRRAHGLLVLPKPGDDATEFTGSGSLQPRCQSGGIVPMQEIRGGADILGRPLRARWRRAERVGEGANLGRQHGWTARQPPGDAACRGDPGGRRSSRGPRLLPCGPAQDDVVVAREALRAHLAMENGGAALTLLPACLDEGDGTVEPARAWGTAVGHELACPDPATHGVARCSETACDLLGRLTSCRR